MAFNLIENLTTAFSNAKLETKMSTFLGENEDVTKAGLDFVLPTLVGFIAKKSTNIEGAGGLLNVIRMGNHSGNIFNTLPSLFDGRTNMKNFIEGGRKANQIYLGEHTDALTGLLNKAAAFQKSESAGNLFNLIAPVILSAINKQVSIQNLQVPTLRDFMKEQVDIIGGYLPKGVHEILGVVETESKPLYNTTPVEKPIEVKKTVKNQEPSVEPISMQTTLRWLGALAGLLVVGYGTWYFLNKPATESTPTTAQAEQTATTQAAPTTTDTPKTTVNNTPTMSEVVLPDGIRINAPKGSLEDKIITYINNPADTSLKSKWLDFDRLPFDGETANFKPEALSQVQNVAAIMKAYPRISFKIGGFLDNATAAAYPRLSSQRAIAVFRELTKAGIQRSRLRADGYGATVQVAPNDTEEGKARNKRVSLTFTGR